MKRKKAAAWTRLDNAAKIFPSTSSKADPKVFRFACELTEEVDPEILQQALDTVIEAFPVFRSVIRRGLFWYYFETSAQRPVVTEESQPPCRPLYDPVIKSLLFSVTYYRRRINLEIYHALTDGTGALQFLRALVCRYLILCHPEQFGDNPPALDYDASLTERTADSFYKHYNPDTKRRANIKKTPACHLKGPRNPDYFLRVIEGEAPVCEVAAKARAYGASITAFLTAVLICAFHEVIPPRRQKKPIAVSIPVNLRNYFESESARNFFGVFTVKYTFHRQSGRLEDVIASVAASFQRELTAENLSRRMNALLALEHNPLVRILPLALKDPVLRLSALISERGETTSLSNIGPVTMPPELTPFISRFDAFVGADRLQTVMCSFNGNLVMSITSPFASADVQKGFFRTLTEMGIPVTIAANTLDEEE
ncbi:hypothetical protein [Anaerotruncus sp.]|jgi:NRPS condensation-like uncharacterized protein|uniref:hypothetical protein n=1 Tax=Anaerotruncus TaxID=244127 RepID=UPI002170750F|nr:MULTISPECIES: hypothetical protein [Anaerotruncus]MCI8493846.1 hypothetical protein [Anaerotruncus sp.]